MGKIRDFFITAVFKEPRPMGRFSGVSFLGASALGYLLGSY
jgi:hypothetical protein